MSSPSSSAAGVAWNLTDLYQSVADPRIDADLATALMRAQAFEQAYRGTIAALGVDGCRRWWRGCKNWKVFVS